MQRHTLSFQLQNLIENERFRKTRKHFQQNANAIACASVVGWRFIHAAAEAEVSRGSASTSSAISGKRSNPLKLIRFTTFGGSTSRAIHSEIADALRFWISSRSIR